MYFESLFTNSPDGILLSTDDGEILRANPAACAALGRTEAELLRINRADLIVTLGHARDGLAHDGSAGNESAGDADVELETGALTLRRSDGSTFPAEYVSAAIPNASVPLSYTIFRDISERRANELALAAALARLDGFMSASPAMKWVKDEQGRLLYVNTAWEKAFGASLAEVQGQREVVLRADDVARQVLLDDAQVLAEGKPISSMESQTVQTDGTLHWFQTVRFPIRDATGAHLIGAVATDVTAQKLAEDALRESEARARAAQRELEYALDVTRRTEEKFRQAQKMEAVGRLAGGIAHDFNNLLTVILGNCETLALHLSKEPIAAEVQEIQNAGNRAATLTRQLLAFSRKQALEPRVLNLNDVLMGMQRMFERLLGEDIDIAFLLNPKAYRCLLDPGQIEQVVLNLVVNARDAMPDGGRLTIETSNVSLDEAYVKHHPEAVTGPHLMLSVSDTGIGMTREVQAHLFEPFYTTKPVGRGTGLGLSTVYGIVKQSGGTIWVYSEPGQGTTFKLYFPEAVTHSELPIRAAVTPADHSGTEAILLVEDDQQVRTTVGGMLRRAGYHVIEASNGGEALMICEQHGGTIALLLTDIVMPKMNGRQLAERLRQIRPELRVIYMSGYTENVVVHHGVVDSGVDFLQKPLISNALLPKVRAVLDRGTGNAR